MNNEAEKKLSACDDQLNCNSLPQFYCQWKRLGTVWTLEAANTPSGAYCNEPARDEKRLEPYCRYPCQETMGADRTEDEPYCRATYRFRRGRFRPIDANSTGGGSCPGNLEDYSRRTPSFFFLVSFEFSHRPYCRGTYRFRCGEFELIEASSTGAVFPPQDLVEFSLANERFSFLVTFEFQPALITSCSPTPPCDTEHHNAGDEAEEPQMDAPQRGQA